MQYTVESKSQLAKLMANENINVEHRNVPTAMFDLKSRTLTCPVWKDMSGDLYDLLLGHEVGHALETPEEGWHNAIMSTGKYNGTFKNFLNVVEDARIEKKIKRRYPGLRLSFIKAYNQLIEKNFFGINGRDINSLFFIDRLNLHTKGGVNLGISFNPVESELLAQVEACETWEDVVRVTQAIFDYSKFEQEEKKQEQMEQLQKSLSEFGGSSDEEPSEDEDYGESGESEDGEESGEYDAGKPHKDGKSDEDDADEELFGIQRHKFSKSVYKDQYIPNPTCETDENYRFNEQSLVDERSLPYIYLNMPKPVMSEILTPYNLVHERMESFWKHYISEDVVKTEQNRLYNEFKTKNDRYISLLAKEFEMRKAASKFAKQKISDSGDIDVSKIYKYKLEDGIFRRLTKVPKGKSHGLMLVFDRSGSMSENMSGTIEQTLVLAMFCRKVNIPFVLYGFGNNFNGFTVDHGRKPLLSFERTKNSLELGNVFLREYLNSDMPASQFTRCVKNLLCLANCYSSRQTRIFYRPESEVLSNTPLNEAVVALKELTVQFRKARNLDIVNTVILHDGDADISRNYINQEGDTVYFSLRRENVIIRDKANKFEKKVSKETDEELRPVIFDWYTHCTGANIIGFFLTGTGSNAKQALMNRYYESSSNVTRSHNERKMFIDTVYQKMKADKFVESKNPGYKKFFLLFGGNNLNIEDEVFEIQGNITQNKLKNILFHK